MLRTLTYSRVFNESSLLLIHFALKTQLSLKIVFQVKMSKRKEGEKGKQQLESLQRIRNLDDKWQ